MQKAGVSRWYQAKKAKDGQESRRALVAVMRKLVPALYNVGVHGAQFDIQRLFCGALEQLRKKGRGNNGMVKTKEFPRRELSRAVCAKRQELP